MTYKIYIKYFFYIFLSVGSIIFTTNFLIDPFGNRNIFVEQKYKPILNERQQKYFFIFNQKNYIKYDSFIFGSSRVMNINPKNLYKYGIIYNFGLHAANNAEKLFLLKELIKTKHPIKAIYLGIDYFNFNINMNQHFVNKHIFKQANFKNYFSFTMLKFTLKSIYYAFNNAPMSFLLKNGAMVYFNEEKLIKENKFDFSNKRYQDGAVHYIQNDFINKKYILDEKVFDILKEFHKLCKQNKISLYVFITPNHEYLRKEFSKHPQIIKKINLIKQRLVSIFGLIYDFSIEDPENKINRNFYDIVHYRDKLGNKIFKSIKNDYNYGKILQQRNPNAL